MSLDKTLKYVSRFKSVHAETYDYSKVEYVRARDKVIITCKIHGDFTQLAESHLKGRGCPLCGNARANIWVKTTFPVFLEKAISSHKEVYQYEEDSFLDMRKKMTIVCSKHGKFQQTPEAHLTGRGCPSCSRTGYDPMLPGFLYVLISGNVTKVGITNLSALQRAKTVSRSAKKKFEVVTYIKFSDGKVADSIETALLRYLRNHYTKTSESHEGHSECFDDVDYDALQKVILKLCSEFLPTL